MRTGHQTDVPSREWHRDKEDAGTKSIIPFKGFLYRFFQPASSANMNDGETCTFRTCDIQSEVWKPHSHPHSLTHSLAQQEQRDVLVQVTLPILKREEERTVLSLKLEYHNVLISKDETLRTSIYIKRVKSVSLDVEPNKAVQLCKLRIQVGTHLIVFISWI